MGTNRFLGIFVNPVYVQNEGLQQVFDNVESVGAKAIPIAPYVARLEETGKGRRFPDLHMDGYERLVARPAWGKREIHLERFLAYEPNLDLYEGCPYRPAAGPAPPDVDRMIPQAMIAEAKKRGLQVHIQVQLWDWLHSLSPRELERSRRLLRNPSELLELLTHHSGWLQFLRFKAQTVVGFYCEVRQLLSRLGFDGVTLSARGWPPPWNRSSGMDYRSLAEHCGAVTPKLFTFDYSALPRWYGQTLVGLEPHIVGV